MFGKAGLDQWLTTPEKWEVGAEEETVADSWACPLCGENRMDWLENEDGEIHCAKCGNWYYLEGAHAETNEL